jgi:hypothetical protein
MCCIVLRLSGVVGCDPKNVTVQKRLRYALNQVLPMNLYGPLSRAKEALVTRCDHVIFVNAKALDTKASH